MGSKVCLAQPATDAQRKSVSTGQTVVAHNKLTQQFATEGLPEPEVSVLIFSDL